MRPLWNLHHLVGCVLMARMTEKIPTPADALHALTEALLALDLSISLHVIQDSQSICHMHTGEIMNRIQKIRRRLQND